MQVTDKSVDKNVVEQRFAQHYQTYNQEAVVQKRIAAELAKQLAAYTTQPFGKLLEVGCGTGFLTEQMLAHFKVENYHLNDLCSNAFAELERQHKQSASACNATCEHFNFSAGDAEHIPFPAQLDGLISSSAMQWFSDLPRFFSRVHHLLNTNGWFAFSTFGPQNFTEIKSTLGVGLNYKTVKELRQLLAAGFELLYVNEWQEEIHFNTPFDVLKHMQLTGVNGVEKQYIGPAKLRQFAQQYRAEYTTDNQQVRLTFHPILIIARKK